MCKFNLHCQSLDGACDCQLLKSQYVYRDVPVQTHSTANAVPNSILTLIRSQTDMIQTLSHQSAQFMSVLAVLSTKLDFLSMAAFQEEKQFSPSVVICEDYIGKDETAVETDVLKVLCGAEEHFESKLTLDSELPSPVYKERAFGLICTVRNMSGVPVSLEKPATCKLLLFTAELPPRLLRNNTSGDKVMRGTVETEVEEGTCKFQRIIIKEVSSHFRNGVFFLVVAVSGHPEIRPLIIPDFVVKARKVLGEVEKPKKKAKVKLES